MTSVSTGQVVTRETSLPRRKDTQAWWCRSAGLNSASRGPASTIMLRTQRLRQVVLAALGEVRGASVGAAEQVLAEFVRGLARCDAGEIFAQAGLDQLALAAAGLRSGAREFGLELGVEADRQGHGEAFL